jgi:acylphosphatase
MNEIAETVRLTALVDGDVQAVGFRWWVRAQALELGLRGSASNLGDGRVEVVVEGPKDTCERLLSRLEEEPSKASRPGRVSAVSPQWSAARGVRDGFSAR